MLHCDQWHRWPGAQAAAKAYHDDRGSGQTEGLAGRDPGHGRHGDRKTARAQTESAPDEAVLVEVNPGHYEIKGEFARGGMGRILLARDLRLGRTVAIKEIHADTGPGGSGRFVREALVTARLQHPAIVPVYEAGRWTGGRPFYAMKLVEGRSRGTLQRGGGPIGSSCAASSPHRGGGGNRVCPRSAG